MLKHILELIMSFFQSKKVEEKPVVAAPMLTKESVVSDEKPYLIKESEILGKVQAADMPDDHQVNLKELLEKINKIRYAWGKPMRVTSGYRSKDDQTRIYKELAAQRGQVFDPNKIPWGSAHREPGGPTPSTSVLH